MPSAWIVPGPQRGDGKLRLVCIPPAGTGACYFTAWATDTELREVAEVWAVELPGRNTRRAEPLRTDLIALACDIADALQPLLLEATVPSTAPAPFALLGWSLGAWLAFEVALVLEQRGLRPAAVYAGGSRPPCASRDDCDPLGPSISQLPAAEFWLRFEGRYGRNPDLQRESIRKFVLPILRADLTLTESYPASSERLSSPLVAIGTRGDGRYTEAQLGDWARHAGGGFEEVWFGGSQPGWATPHRLLADDPSPFLAWLAADLPARSG